MAELVPDVAELIIAFINDQGTRWEPREATMARLSTVNQSFCVGAGMALGTESGFVNTFDDTDWPAAKMRLFITNRRAMDSVVDCAVGGRAKAYGVCDRLFGAIGRRRHLQRLTLREATYVRGDDLRLMLQGLPRLTALSLHDCRHLTDADLVTIATAAPQLLALELVWARCVSEDGLAGLSGFCALEVVSLRSCRNLTDAACSTLATAVPKLKCLDMMESLGMQYQGFSALGQLSQTLRELHLASTGVGDRGVYLLCEALPRLVSFDLSTNVEVSDAALPFIAQLQDLHTLQINACPRITDSGLERFRLGGAAVLETLGLAENYDVATAGIHSVAALPRLQCLDLVGVRVCDTAVNALVASRTLKTVHVNDACKFTYAGLRAALDADPPLELVWHQGIETDVVVAATQSSNGDGPVVHTADGLMPLPARPRVRW